MSWKPEIKVFGEKQFYSNSQVFETYEEAHISARNRHFNWTMAEDFRVVESEEPVNYKWVDGVGDVRLEDN
jgi:hypothetical protein